MRYTVRLTVAVAVVSLLIAGSVAEGAKKGTSPTSPATPTAGPAPEPSSPGSTSRTCDQTGIGQRFLAWSDPAYYMPVAGGSFEDGAAGWELGKGASLTRNGNPEGTPGYALELGSGATVTSPPICVHLEYPTARMFAKKESGKDALLGVEVVYAKPDRTEAKFKTASLAVADRWDATAPWKMPSEKQLGIYQSKTVTDAGAVDVRFRFTAPPGSHWKIDDVFVDPRMRR